jgi:hypothetical protein
LNLLGAALPHDLLAASKGNPLGHWEPAELKRAHDALLSELGTAWDRWDPLPADWLSHPAVARQIENFAAFIAENFASHSLFVLKDPRMCRLMPAWKLAFKLAGADLRAVLTVRNPLDVASSLAQRDGMSSARASMTWLRYTCDAEFETRDVPRCAVSYDGLISDWAGTAAAISRHLALEWSVAPLAAEPAVADFLTPSARHHTSEAESLAASDLHPWVKQGYRALSDLIGSPRSQQAEASLDEVRAKLDEAGLAIGPLLEDAIRTSSARATRTRQRLKEERAKALAEAKKLATTVAKQDQLVADHRSTNDMLRGEALALEKRVDKLVELLTLAQRENVSLAGRVEEVEAAKEKEIARLQSSLRERSDELQSIGGRHAAREADLEQELHRWQSVAQRLCDEIGAKTKQVLDTARAEATAQNDAIRALEIDRADALEKLAGTRDEIRDLAGASEALKSRLDEAERGRLATSEKLADLKQAQGALVKDLAAAKSRAKALKEERQELRQTLNEAVSARQSAQENLAIIEAAQVELHRRIQAFKKDRIEMRRRLQEQEALAKRLAGDAAAAELKYSQLRDSDVGKVIARTQRYLDSGRRLLRRTSGQDEHRK